MSVEKKTPVAVLISGTGSNLQALIDAEAGRSYQVTLVISNRPNTIGIAKASQQNIPTLVIDHSLYKTREEFDSEVIKAIEAANITTVILAGFMRILTMEFTRHFLGRMLNIHPSLLPKYPGLNTHQKALENQDSEHGLSIHFVTAELDGGPVIQQASFPIQACDSVDSLKKTVQKLEHQCYPDVVDWLVTDKLKLKNNQAFFNQQPLLKPLQFC